MEVYQFSHLNPLDKAASKSKHAAGPGPLATINGSSVKPEIIEYLWDRRIPKGKYTLLAGEPEAGKSCVMLDICARATTGEPWPFETQRREPVGVLIGCPEDGIADTVVPRLIAAGADMRRVEFLDDVLFDLNDTDRLEQFLTEKGIGLLTLDPITAYQPGGKNGNDEGDVRGMLHPLIDVLGRTGTALLASKHTKKIGADSPLKMIMGATAWGAMARSVLGAATMDDEGDDVEARVLLKMKLNVDRDPGGLIYEVYGAPHPADAGTTIAAVRWLRQDQDVQAADVFGCDGTRGGGPKVAEARKFLRATLESGPMEQRLVWEAADRAGVKGSLKRAKKLECVESYQMKPPGTPDNPTFWRMPGGSIK